MIASLVPDVSVVSTGVLRLDGLAVESFDTLLVNGSSRVISFAARNYFLPVQANISFSGENLSCSRLANLTQGESLMVFAVVNNSLGDGKAVSVLLSGNDSVNYTRVYDVPGVVVDGFQRVDLSNVSRVYLFAVRNVWQNTSVSWNLSDPVLSNASVLANNASLLIFVAQNYTNDSTPVLRVNSGGYVVRVSDQSSVRPVALSRVLTLRDGATAISEMFVTNALSARNITWRYDTGLLNLSNTTVVNSSILLIIQSNYSSSGVYRTTAFVNSSSYNDTETGVVIA